MCPPKAVKIKERKKERKEISHEQACCWLEPVAELVMESQFEPQLEPQLSNE